MVMEKTESQDNKPHFFKPILSNSSQKLSIPVAFLGNLKVEKPKDEAILRSDNIPGKSWTVKVLEGRIFQDGWEEFANDHELRFGDFLVFRHEGGWVFHVKVFAITACEKQYLLPLQRKRREDENDSETEDVVSISGEEDKEEKVPYFTAKIQGYNFISSVMVIPTAFARSNNLVNKYRNITLLDNNGRPWDVNLRNNKISGGWKKYLEDNRLKTGDLCTFELVSKGKNVVFKVTISCSDESDNSNQLITNGKKRKGRDLDCKKKISMPEDEDEKEIFKSEDEDEEEIFSMSEDQDEKENLKSEDEEATYFTVKIQRYNISKSIMYIPRLFARSNNLSNVSRTIMIIDKNDRSWQINLRYYKCDGHSYLSGGWRNFFEDNRLKIGDVCTFKLVSNGKNVVLEVKISYSNGGSSSFGFQPSRTVEVEKEEEEEEEEKEEEAPYFAFPLKQWHFTSSIVYIPAVFARSNKLMDAPGTITLIDTRGRSWQVNLRQTMCKGKSQQTYIAGGWSKFLQDNRLNIGDTCMFKLVANEKNVVFEVTVSYSNGGSSLDDTDQLTKSSEEEKKPYFTIFLQHGHFTSSNVKIPGAFARSNKLMDAPGTITLTDKRGRTWEVNLRQTQWNGKIHQAYIAGGWPKFLEDNRLNIGDMCTFKLVSNGENVVFKVTIAYSNGVYASSCSDETDQLVMRNEEEEEEAPFFTAQMKRYNFTCSIMHIPRTFARSNNLSNVSRTIMFVDKNGRSWQVNLRYNKCDRQTYIAGGWSKFIEDNRLNIGDSCTFKLVSNGKNIVFEVTVSYSNGGSTLDNTDQLTMSEVEEEEEAPFFTAQIQSYNLTNRIMFIPKEFARDNGLMKRRCMITLADEQGILWEVKMTYKSSSNQVYIGLGWREFSIGNKLGLGDMCTFKLVTNGRKVVFEVTISHFIP